MANYREIKGFTIQTFSSDPSSLIKGFRLDYTVRLFYDHATVIAEP